jgi:hypothetical protein
VKNTQDTISRDIHRTNPFVDPYNRPKFYSTDSFHRFHLRILKAGDQIRRLPNYLDPTTAFINILTRVLLVAKHPDTYEPLD